MCLLLLMFQRWVNGVIMFFSLNCIVLVCITLALLSVMYVSTMSSAPEDIAHGQPMENPGVQQGVASLARSVSNCEPKTYPSL